MGTAERLRDFSATWSSRAQGEEDLCVILTVEEETGSAGWMVCG